MLESFFKLLFVLIALIVALIFKIEEPAYVRKYIFGGIQKNDHNNLVFDGANFLNTYNEVVNGERFYSMSSMIECIQYIAQSITNRNKIYIVIKNDENLEREMREIKNRYFNEEKGINNPRGYIAEVKNYNQLNHIPNDFLTMVECLKRDYISILKGIILVYCKSNRLYYDNRRRYREISYNNMKMAYPDRDYDEGKETDRSNDSYAHAKKARDDVAASFIINKLNKKRPNDNYLISNDQMTKISGNIRAVKPFAMITYIFDENKESKYIVNKLDPNNISKDENIKSIVIVSNPVTYEIVSNVKEVAYNGNKISFPEPVKIKK